MANSSKQIPNAEGYNFSKSIGKYIRIGFSQRHDGLKNLFNLSIHGKNRELFIATATNHLPVIKLVKYGC